MNKEKYNIVYKHFAKPIYNMAMTYESSCLTVELGAVNPKVVKCFNELKKALEEQLKSYR